MFHVRQESCPLSIIEDAATYADSETLVPTPLGTLFFSWLVILPYFNATGLTCLNVLPYSN